MQAVQDVTPEQKDQDDKYSVKLQLQLKSRFLAEQEKKKQEAEAALLVKQKQQEVKWSLLYKSDCIYAAIKALMRYGIYRLRVTCTGSM